LPHTASCLCGGVRIEIDRLEGPFELCHCSRCRRTSGSAFAAGIWTRSEDVRWIRGRELVSSYEAPLLEAPPLYKAVFCRVCGSRLPDPDPPFHMVDVPAGLLDRDSGLRPEHHLIFGPKAPWYEISDALPRMGRPEVREYRRARWFGKESG
jgi:hypothetical protein